MYDFYYGTKEDIEQNQEDFLIFCKRLLPRWINGIPDSECLALYRSLQEIDSEKPILLETGCGASTLALFLYASLNNGQVYSWDTSGSKGHFLRSVISESICAPLGVNLHEVWTFIGFDSTSHHAGIPILEELGLKADFGYFDSWHTLNHLMKEIQCMETVVGNNFFIALDDAYYRKKEENYSFINMIRKKLDLQAVKESPDNICDPFYMEVEKYLKEKYQNVIMLDDTYKDEYSNDLFFDYYSQDRNAMAKVGMEEKENLEHRFDVWKVSKL